MKTNYLPLWATTLFVIASLLSSCKKELEETTPNPPKATGSARVNVTISPANSTIYVVHNSSLYAVNPSDFQDYKRIGGGWGGTNPTLANDGYNIYAIQLGKLWQADRFNGNYKSIGNGNWQGAVGVTGVAGFVPDQGNMFAQAGDYLWKIDLYHVHHQLGEGGWSGTRAIFYHRNFLYVIWSNGYLYQVNASNGTWKELSGGWGNVKAIAAPATIGQDIYIVEGSNLWRVNVQTGKGTYLKGGFDNTTAMTGVKGYLYIAANNGLYKLDGNGNKIMSSYFFNGVTSMGAYEGSIN